MKPAEAVQQFWQTVKQNAGDLPYRVFIHTFVGILTAYLKENYPDPASLQQDIAAGRPVLDEALAMVPADSLVMARTAAAGVVARAGVQDYDRILAGIGQELPDHEMVLYAASDWYIAAMERAKSWFLGHPAEPLTKPAPEPDGSPQS